MADPRPGAHGRTWWSRLSKHEQILAALIGAVAVVLAAVLPIVFARTSSSPSSQPGNTVGSSPSPPPPSSPSQPSRFSIIVTCHDNTATVRGRFPARYVGTEVDFVFNSVLPATNRITSLAPKLSFQKQFQIAQFLKGSHHLIVLVIDPQSHELARRQVACL
jgi:hypothetical protein